LNSMSSNDWLVTQPKELSGQDRIHLVIKL
jgi:hypothetical protein